MSAIRINQFSYSYNNLKLLPYKTLRIIKQNILSENVTYMDSRYVFCTNVNQTTSCNNPSVAVCTINFNCRNISKNDNILMRYLNINNNNIYLTLSAYIVSGT